MPIYKTTRKQGIRSVVCLLALGQKVKGHANIRCPCAYSGPEASPSLVLHTYHRVGPWVEEPKESVNDGLGYPHGRDRLARGTLCLAAVAGVGSLPFLPTLMGLSFSYRGGFTVWSDLACSHIQPHALN